MYAHNDPVAGSPDATNLCRASLSTMDADRDLEKGGTSPEPVAEGGYDRLAGFMGRIPDLAIFHRFASLSVESLLHYQAEIMELQSTLEETKRADKEAGGDRGRYAFNSEFLRDSVEEHEEGDAGRKQWETMLKLRELIKEYYSALILHNQVVNLKKPHPELRDALLDWKQRIHRGNITLTGNDRRLYENSSPEELVTMQPASRDGKSSGSTLKIARWYHETVGRRIHRTAEGDHLQNTIIYEDDGALEKIRVVKSLVASMLPIISILGLYYIENMGARLGVTAALTAIFSITLGYFTSASIKDVFSATAAFSAVLVVFVGTTK